MAKRIKIEFVNNPSSGTNIGFEVTYGANSNFKGATLGITVSIGLNKEATALNLYNWYLLPGQFPAWQTAIQTITLTSNIIYFDFDVVDESILSFPILDSSSADVLINEIVPPIEEPLRIALARSTYSLRITPSELYDTAELGLFIWQGDINNVPIVASYNLSKQVVQLGQTTINFDINNLIKEFTQGDISNYLLSGVQPSNYNASTWVYYYVACYNNNDNIYETSGTLLGVYGYGYFNEGFNPQLSSKVLISNNNQRHFRDQDNRLYFITDGLTSLEVNGDAITITANLDLNTEYIQSINLKDYDTDDAIICEFVYEDETRTITYDVLDGCIYPVINCVFINKFGFPQSFFLTLVNKITDQVDSEDYRGLTSNFGIYNTADHQYSNFNLNGRSEIVCNTDYLNEIENENIKQMLLSEKIWFIEDGEILPVNLESKSVAYKTQLNDKLIQYSFNFKYSFDIINNVQ
jgi:hypothetical protein